MFRHLKSFLALFKKEEKHDVGLDFIQPVISSIKEDIEGIDKSFKIMKNLIESGVQIGFDKIPSTRIYDLLEKITEFSALVESSDLANRIRMTELSAKMHDNAVKCSGMVSFLVSSADPYSDMDKIMVFFRDIESEFEELCQLT